MLRLISPALLAPAALVLAPGSVVTVRRLTMVEWEAAEAEAAALTEAVRDGADVLSGLGVDLPAEADGSIAGLPRYLLAIEVGIRAITGWEGIGDAEGNPVDVNRDAVALLVADPRHGRRILGAAFGHVGEVIAEGKGFAASQTGAGEVAESIAPDAGNSASPAPGADAGRTGPAARNTRTGRRAATAPPPSP